VNWFIVATDCRQTSNKKPKTQTPPVQYVPGSRLVSLRRRRKKKEPDLQRWRKWRRGHAQRAAPWPKNYATTANPKMLAAELYSEKHTLQIHSLGKLIAIGDLRVLNGYHET
jgi:hypothetical protein